MGVTTGCGCKEVYRFPHTTYPYSLHLFFLQQYPYFLFIKKKKSFSFLCPSTKFYVLNIFSRSINTYEQLRASHGSHMKAVHKILYMKKHTQTYASYPTMDISCMTSRSVV